MMARPRLGAIFALSLVLTMVATYNAYRKNQQFYLTVLYMSKSNLTLTVVYFQISVLALMVVKLVKSIFFGDLRTVEVEHLMDRSWYAVTETCLAFTVFRDDFSPKFVVMFTILLLIKCAHWLAEDRVEYAEQSPDVQSVFHIRTVSLLILLLFADCVFTTYSFKNTLRKGASVQIVFGFEYAVLLLSAAGTWVKYLLYVVDSQHDQPWEEKGTYLLYAELVMSFLRVSLYSFFVGIMMKVYTLPLFIIRPYYLSFRSLKKAINDVVLARQAISNLNNMYPDVTQAELNRYSDLICIICRDEMSAEQQIKSLPCHHIFHRSCLRNWFQRQQTCPTCRIDVLRHRATTLNNNQNNNVNPIPDNQQNPFQQDRPAARQQQPVAPASQQQQFENQQQANHHHHQQQQQQQQQQQRGGAPQARAPFIIQPMNAAQPPMFYAGGIALPPFAFPPPPPPPLPSVNLLQAVDPAGIAAQTAELKLREQDERRQVLVRLETLRNVRCCLDAAFVQLNMYLNMGAASSAVGGGLDTFAEAINSTILNTSRDHETGDWPTRRSREHGVQKEGSTTITSSRERVFGASSPLDSCCPLATSSSESTMPMGGMGDIGGDKSPSGHGKDQQQ